MEIAAIRREVRALKNTLYSSDRKYYHLHSIENFLHHFNALADNESKKYIQELLSNCIEYYNYHSIPNVIESLDIFQKFLKPAGKIYERKLNFFILIKPWLLTLYILVRYLIVFLAFNNNQIATLIFLFIVLILIIFLGIKFSQYKLNAFLW